MSILEEFLNSTQQDHCCLGRSFLLGITAALTPGSNGFFLAGGGLFDAGGELGGKIGFLEDDGFSSSTADYLPCSEHKFTSACSDDKASDLPGAGVSSRPLAPPSN